MAAATVPIEKPGQVWYLALSSLAFFVPTVFVFMRLLAKRILGRAFDDSDACISIALFFNTCLQVAGWIMVWKGGFGFHLSEIATRFGQANLMVFFKCIFAFAQLWHVATCFSKLSVLCTYRALLPVPRLILAVRVLGTFIMLWAMGSIVSGMLMCRPFAYTWDTSIPGGRCGDWRVYYTVMGTWNVVLDVLILLLPLPFFVKLQISLSKRLLVVAIFSVGWGTCAITIYRQATLIDLDFADMTYSGLIPTLFSAIEPASAVTLACVPFLRPVVCCGRPGEEKGKGEKAGLEQRWIGEQPWSRPDGCPLATWQRQRRARWERSRARTVHEWYDQVEAQIGEMSSVSMVTRASQRDEERGMGVRNPWAEGGRVAVERSWEVKSMRAEAREGKGRNSSWKKESLKTSRSV